MCKVKVLDGEYEHEVVRSHEYLPDEELNNRFALACCMTPKSNLEIITIEEYEKQKKE
jgi:ferredoxin